MPTPDPAAPRTSTPAVKAGGPQLPTYPQDPAPPRPPTPSNAGAAADNPRYTDATAPGTGGELHQLPGDGSPVMTTSQTTIPYAIPRLEKAGYQIVAVDTCMGSQGEWPYEYMGEPGQPDSTWVC